jgi:hypothetical protein
MLGLSSVLHVPLSEVLTLELSGAQYIYASFQSSGMLQLSYFRSVLVRDVKLAHARTHSRHPRKRSQRHQSPRVPNWRDTLHRFQFQHLRLSVPSTCGLCVRLTAIDPELEAHVMNFVSQPADSIWKSSGIRHEVAIVVSASPHGPAIVDCSR